ncbi:MAG: hypothetical protein PHS73_02985 [Candidatus Peribacteraceae bacterium]|nr:hypothetical protein [Candidatus Peribacteraceae bacterium]
MTEQPREQRQSTERPPFRSDPLRRTPQENREPVETEETERAEADGLIQSRKFEQTLTIDPKDNAEAQNAKNRLVRRNCEAFKKRGPPHLAEAARDAQLTINDRIILPLQQEWRRVFLPEQPMDGMSPTTRREYRTAFGDPLKKMLEHASTEAVIIYGGRVCNRVGLAAGRMRELDHMLKDPLLRESAIANPQIRQHIRAVRASIINVRRFFKGLQDGDPAWRDTMQLIRPERRTSAAMEQGKMALKMLALLAASGMALLSGLIDIKNKKISPYTLAWLGIAGYTAGAFRGRHAAIVQQLDFLPKAEWEALGITGEDGVLLFDRIRRKTKQAREARQKLLKKEITPQQYIEALLGKNPQGNDARIAKKLMEIAAKGPETFIYMVKCISGVTDRAAQTLWKDMARNGTNSKTAGAAIGKPVSTK